MSTIDIFLYWGNISEPKGKNCREKTYEMCDVELFSYSPRCPPFLSAIQRFSYSPWCPPFLSDIQRFSYSPWCPPFLSAIQRFSYSPRCPPITSLFQLHEINEQKRDVNKKYYEPHN